MVKRREAKNINRILHCKKVKDLPTTSTRKKHYRLQKLTGEILVGFYTQFIIEKS